MVSIVIPCYNEEKRIASRLPKIRQYFSNKKGYEIIFVNDGSKDRTLQVLKEFQKKFPCKIITYEKNKGKGGAVRTGVLAAKGEIIGMMDADLATDLREVENIVEAMKQKDVVVGFRKRPQRSFIRTILSKGFSLYARVLFSIPVHDTQCGFKFFRKKCKPLFKALISNGWAFDVEVLFRAKKAGLIIGEIPVLWAEQGGSRLKSTDGIKMAWQLLKLRVKL